MPIKPNYRTSRTNCQENTEERKNIQGRKEKKKTRKNKKTILQENHHIQKKKKTKKKKKQRKKDHVNTNDVMSKFL